MYDEKSAGATDMQLQKSSCAARWGSQFTSIFLYTLPVIYILLKILLCKGVVGSQSVPVSSRCNSAVIVGHITLTLRTETLPKFGIGRTARPVSPASLTCGSYNVDHACSKSVCNCMSRRYPEKICSC